MKLNLWWTLTKRDCHNQPIQTIKLDGHSLVVAFIAILNEQAGQTSIAPTTLNVDGGTRTTISYFNNLTAQSPVSDASLGLVIGSNNTPVAFTHFSLYGKIPQGINAGQIAHSQSSTILYTTTPTSGSFAVNRSFSNVAPAGTITARELGWYTRGDNIASTFMIAREVIPDTTIQVGQTLDVTMTVEIQLT